jgi:hypothetical protein
MNEIFMLLVCFDEENNIYDRYFFSTFEKAFEFTKTLPKDPIQSIYIEKIVLDDGKAH